MILPDGCDCQFNLPSSSERTNSLVSNREHTIVLVVTNNSLYFYLADTRLLACVFQRDEEDIKERGSFKRAYWKPDSTAICITTANNFLNIYSVEISYASSSFNLHDPNGEAIGFSRESSELFMVRNRPQININLTVVARLEAEPTCVISFKDELLLSLTDGWLHRLSWAGVVLPELSFNIRSLCPEPKDKGQSKQKQNLHILDIAPFLGGVCGVFQDGRAALLISSAPDFKFDSLTPVWATGLVDACCCSTNFKFRLIYFGCKNGDIACYSLDDINGGLVQLFRIHLRLKNGTEFLDRLSSVKQISCLTPQGTAFAVIWERKMTNGKGTKLDIGEDSSNLENGTTNLTGHHHQMLKACPPTLAIFSPFGEQWWCSLEDNCSDLSNEFSANFDPCIFTALDWAIDGYQLWLGTSNSGVQLVNLVKSIPNSHDQLMMVGADRVYLCPTDNNDDGQLTNSAPHLIWQLCKPVHNYIASNLPIKHVAFSQNPEKVLVVGGTHGFCIYNFKNAKWRMFRKEAQEKSLLLTGGLAIFQQFILCSACNLEANNDEPDRLYAFRIDEQLDLDLCHSTPTNRILQMKISGGSHLITFDVDSVISIYSISIQASKEKPSSKFTSMLEMDCIAEIRITEFLPHPSCLVSMELAKLNFHADALPFCDDMDSLLINVSGHLLLLSPMQPQINGQNKRENNTEESLFEFQLHPPTLVASLVEEFWIIHANKNSHQNGMVELLSEALWINAGCKKSRIWLPLSLEMEKKKSTNEKAKPQLAPQNSRSFISRRIMLPFAMDIYPLFIGSNYLACGANCTSSQLKSDGGKLVGADDVSLVSRFTEDDSLNDFEGLPPKVAADEHSSSIYVHSLVRTSEVFIHKLLKQLLKRNLGSYAFELASSCRSLSYFRHILELLLHDLLDEEATSSEPIPDPLLPTVVSFLREFPGEYLQTIVHCARKTELAFWNLLFSVSNHPRQLFQMCLQEGQLETATSCLIILHSLISIQESCKLAFALLEEALTRRRWSVAQDIVRFMQNINRATERDSLDYGDTPESPMQGKLASLPHHHPMTAFNSSNDEFNFPLFSSQIDIDSSSAPAFVHQRRRSGSGKMVASDSSHPKHVAAFAGSRKQSKPTNTASSNVSPPSNKDKMVPKKASPPPLTIKMPSKNDQQQQMMQQHENAAAHYSGLDDILAKHASNLLENYALRDLGAFSSYLPLNFVDFFRRAENQFAIPATEFPLVLMKLHAQFNWPYPIAIVGHFPRSPSVTDENGKAMDKEKVVAQNSNSSNNFGAAARERSGSMNSSATGSTSAMSGTTTSTGGTFVYDWKALEKMSKGQKGTEQADAELSFVFDQLKEAGAFEWLFLICILRRDIRLFNDQVLAPMRELAGEEQGKRFNQFLARIGHGTKELHVWAQTICPAYLPVMRAFKDFVGYDKNGDRQPY